jgi:hypothetical protein
MNTATRVQNQMSVQRPVEVANQLSHPVLHELVHDATPMKEEHRRQLQQCNAREE